MEDLESERDSSLKIKNVLGQLTNRRNPLSEQHSVIDLEIVFIDEDDSYSESDSFEQFAQFEQ